MSVVVRMEMPENCEKCCLRVNDSPTNVPNWICAINQWPTFYCKNSQNHANEDKYLHDCPIICQLPEGHGRLIDGSNLAEKHRKLAYKDNNKYGFHITAKAWVEESITIVPAAERRETEQV